MTVKELKDFLMNYPDNKIIDIMIEDIEPLQICIWLWLLQNIREN